MGNVTGNQHAERRLPERLQAAMDRNLEYTASAYTKPFEYAAAQLELLEQYERQGELLDSIAMLRARRTMEYWRRRIFVNRRLDTESSILF